MMLDPSAEKAVCTPNSVLITGGAGFVGSNLALHLKQAFPACHIVCMDNLHRNGSELNVPRLQDAGCLFHQGDIRDPLQFPAGPFEYVLECSAEPSVLAGLDGSPDYLYQTNMTGAYHCLEAARRWQAGFLFLSTSRVYPIAALECHPWQEQDTRFVWQDVENANISSKGVRETLLPRSSGPRSLYGWTKYAAELLIEEYRAAFGLRSVINRCGVIAGPWQFGKVDQGVLALWVLHHHYRRPLRYIGYGGNGKQVRDVLHIADLCRLVETQLSDFDSWQDWCGNVSGGLDCSASLLELTALCQETIGNKIDIARETENRPADLRIFIADCAELFRRSSWRPQHSVRDIVADTAAWVAANEELLKKL